MLKNLKIWGGLGVLILALAFSPLPSSIAQASTCTQNTNLNFIVSSPSGSFVANARVLVYKQVSDINGEPKPGVQVASANTDAILGKAQLSWRASATTTVYALEVLPAGNSSSASFWYYNNTLNCGQSATLGKTLSGILFSLHDSKGNPLLNTSFKVYSQVYDLANRPQEQLNQLLASPNSGSSGQVMVYLPQGSQRNMARTLSDSYALELNRNSQNFIFYNIAVHDGQLTNLNYFVPSLQVKLQDTTGALFPSGTRVVVFKQTVDANNLRQAGAQVGSFTLGANGSGSLDLPPGLYVLGIKDQNNTYQYFWDMQVIDGKANTYTVSASANSASSNLTTSCQSNSRFTLSLENMSGELIPGMKFALYEQNTNAKALPIPGKQVGYGTISSSGQASFSFRPDPRKLYALKVWDRNSNLGAFWFFSAVRFVCSYDRTLSETIPALHIVLRDSQGQLKRNYSFSLYEQRYDADNQPYFQNNDLVASLRSDGGGQATLYVAPYNPYLPNQSGIYALSLRDSSGKTTSFYNIKIPVNKDYTFQTVLSGISGQLQNPQGQVLSQKSLELYSEDTSATHLSLGSRLLSLRTDNNGKFKFEYPAGNYALVSLDSFNQKNVFWNLTANAGNNYHSLKTSAASFSLSDPQGQGLANNSSLRLYSLVRANNGAYYQSKQLGTIQLERGKATLKSLAAGTYLAIYTGLGNQQYGQAFYLKNGDFYAVKISLSSQYLIRANQAFYLPGAANIIPLSASISAVSNSGKAFSNSPKSPIINKAKSLASRLKGRILLQVQAKGQAWYVNPVNNERYFMGRPADAFNLMRRFALGISNSNFVKLENNSSAFKHLAGRILLKTEDHGRAYYFNPVNLKLYYLGRPADAFRIMRTLGLGITNNNLTQINKAN